MLKGIYKHREILQEHLSRFAEKSDAAIWRDWLERYTPVFDEDLIIGGFLSLCKKAENLCTDPEDNLYKTLREMYENYSAICVKDPAERRAAFLTCVIRKSGFIKNSDKEYRKDPEGNKLNWKDGKAETASWFEDVKNSISIGDLMGTPGTEDRRIIPLLRNLFELFRQFDADYLEVRKNRNVLDFSDIILFTHRLLRDNPDIRQKLAQRYRHVMVDEFQDTNPVRWEIIRSIFLSAGAEGEDNGIRLFIVGDRKQSIYRFNNADVTVMNDAETLIRERGGEILDFNDNYRSAENFIDKGINRIFGDAQIMPPEDSPRKPYEAFFESTVYTGKAQDRVEKVLEFHWCKKEDTVSDAYLPARHAAHRVREVLKELREAGVKRDPGKPLVGVLLRKFTHIGEYLRAFRMLDIPVSIVGGRGFYQSGAVRDVFHFLSVLDNPLDDHALAGLLRSPLMSVPDPEIHVLSDRERDTPLFRAMRDSGSPLLRACAAEIAQWRERSRRLTPDVLLTQIVEEKDAELGYVGELMPRQRLANLDKAVNIIGGLVRKGRSLRGIREYFHYQINHNTSEPQASYPEHAEVHILTVHKAKGLQFPAVVIPEMNASGRGNTESFRFGRKNGYPEVSLSLPGEELRDPVRPQEQLAGRRGGGGKTCVLRGGDPCRSQGLFSGRGGEAKGQEQLVEYFCPPCLRYRGKRRSGHLGGKGGPDA
ncbi:MAG: UvrD-helicase domain-containing protein [Candidatus Marinimicrobia bacterium]|nr:UvrD-helicase domain-containing protein [Candidatus Neomarinimicrobiota bacterium]